MWCTVQYGAKQHVPARTFPNPFPGDLLLDFASSRPSWSIGTNPPRAAPRPWSVFGCARLCESVRTGSSVFFRDVLAVLAPPHDQFSDHCCALMVHGQSHEKANDAWRQDNIAAADDEASATRRAGPRASSPGAVGDLHRQPGAGTDRRHTPWAVRGVGARDELRCGCVMAEMMQMKE
jgi:hypothetical protein